jgi:protein O-GlcNAc transferase
MRENVVGLWWEYLKNHFASLTTRVSAADRWLALAARCIDAGQDGLAARCARRAGRAGGNPSIAVTQLGHMYYERRRYDKARLAFEAAMALDFTNADAQRSLAMSCHNQRDFGAATYYYLLALSSDPDDLESRVNLGLVYHAEARLDEAIEQFRLVLEQRDESLGVPWFEYFALGRAMYDNAEFEEAQEALARAVELNSLHAESHFYLGKAEWALGNSEEAVRSVREALELDPADPYSRLDFADMLGELGDGKGAVDHGRVALSAFAADGSRLDEARALWTIGWGHYVEREWEASAEASRAAIEIDPQLEPVRFNLGLALLREGHPEEARHVYQEALNLPSLDIWDLEAHGINDVEEAMRADSSIEGAAEILELLRAKHRTLAGVR